MAKSVAFQADAVPPKNDRSGSDHDRTALLPVRTTSGPLRIDPKAEFLSAVNETRTRLGRSVESMAACAGVAVSQMSEALAGKEGRGNFAGHWLLAQGDDFQDTYNRIVEERRGVTPAAKKARRANAIAELVRFAIEEAS